MSTLVDLLPQTLPDEIVEHQKQDVSETAPSHTAVKTRLELFEAEQLRGLVRQVFLSPTTPCNQVVFSPVDPGVDTRLLCRQIGLTLSQCVTKTVCVVEGAFTDKASDRSAIHLTSSQKYFGMLRDSAEQLSANLWIMGPGVFANSEGASPAVWLRERLAELRLEFDYAILQGPSCLLSEGSLLGSLCDGLVLVIQANRTRRAAAQKAKLALDAANVKLLGTVLSDRTFPIPEAIYKRV